MWLYSAGSLERVLMTMLQSFLDQTTKKGKCRKLPFAKKTEEFLIKWADKLSKLFRFSWSKRGFEIKSEKKFAILLSELCPISTRKRCEQTNFGLNVSSAKTTLLTQYVGKILKFKRVLGKNQILYDQSFNNQRF